MNRGLTRIRVVFGFAVLMMGAVGLIDSPSAASGQLDHQGQFAAIVDWPIVPIHTAITADGLVMSYGTTTEGEQSGLLTYDIWDPVSGAHLTMDNTTQTDLFCSIQAIDPFTDEMLTVGGDDGTFGTSFGNNTVTVYSTADGLRSGTSMNYARWYPTATTLPNGEILIQGGGVEGVYGDGVYTPEIYTSGGGWRELIGATSDYAYGNDEWRWWYPRSWVAPDGSVFGLSGSHMYSLDPSGDGSISELGGFPGDNIGATSTAVMFRPGKILQVGGGAFHTDDWSRTGSTAATVVDINGPTPVLTSAAPMQNQRHWGTATVLADGDVLVTGGSTVQNADTGPVAYEPELWDPDTDTWTTMATHQKMRLYHSTSLLLPDGRVLVGGGGQPGPQLNLNAEIFSPPYLFDGDQPAVRPGISGAPSKVRYNESFEIEVDGDVASVSFIKTGAVTHSFDASTRWMELEISGTGDQRVVRAPANANLAPPGSYMLFALDNDGTPSVAKLIEIDPGEPVQDPVEPLPKFEPGTMAEAETLDEFVAATDYDLEVHGGILRFYRAFFGREPDLTGAKYWVLDVYESGEEFSNIIEWFASPDQPEFAAQYADIDPDDNAAYLTRVYNNMLGRVPDAGGFEYWRSLMDDGALNRAQVVLYVGLNTEFINRFPYRAS
jgi:hypothetical protein